MSILSTGYLIFVFVGLAAYYGIPQRYRYYWLLILSGLFILSNSPMGLVFVVGTSLIVYLAARAMPGSKQPKAILLAALIACLSVLVTLKYLAVYLPEAPRGFISKYLYPVGLSYYTLQLISYLMDVYWERLKPERNFGKLLLFTSYFPQLIQGPISKYSELSGELFKPSVFSWKNLKFGVQLMLWGFFQKMVIADRLSGYVTAAFWSGNPPAGLTVWAGLFLYSIQLYCDFCGGINVVRGISMCYGIGLKENFRQPYFAQTLGEFWRRWHISLGEWMKDYVFYPISTSKTMAKLKKAVKKRYDRKTAAKVSIAIANICVFTLVGLWHGTGTNYLAWGLYNGTILAVSGLCEDSCRRTKERLHIPVESPVWKGFCVVRTFLIVMIGNAFDCAPTCGSAVRMIGRMFGAGWTAIDREVTIGILVLPVLLAVDLMHERKISIRDTLDKQREWVQMLFWLIVIQVIAGLGKAFSVGGFLYANF